MTGPGPRPIKPGPLSTHSTGFAFPAVIPTIIGASGTAAATISTAPALRRPRIPVSLLADVAYALLFFGELAAGAPDDYFAPTDAMPVPCPAGCGALCGNPCASGCPDLDQGDNSERKAMHAVVESMARRGTVAEALWVLSCCAVHAAHRRLVGDLWNLDKGLTVPCPDPECGAPVGALCGFRVPRANLVHFTRSAAFQNHAERTARFVALPEVSLSTLSDLALIY